APRGRRTSPRLFDVNISLPSLRMMLATANYRPDENLLALRKEREKLSDQAIRDAYPHLRTLASMPFVRMIAFSGATAHRNMNSKEDIDLFLIVEDGKLWASFLLSIVWAKARGLRARLCLNYLISDAALPLLDHDIFTAQQVASLKPIYGKS